MRKQEIPTEPPASDAPISIRASQMAPDETFDDEEKLLDGHHDVNMPALLTRDVKGG
jgi:hypothetical protein